jgi:hypothetical protein
VALSKKDILSINDTKTESVTVPEWNDATVYVRTISGTEREAFEESYAEQKMKNFRMRFLVKTLCDESGERLFDDADVEELGKKSSAVINRLFDKAWALNAFTPEAVEKLGEA